MGDSVTASPPEIDPIVTPRPPKYLQYAPKLGAVPMRPTMNPDTREDMTPEEFRVYTTETYPRLCDEAKKAKKPKNQYPRSVHVDAWGASGCHPTVVAMQMAWFLSHPRTSDRFVLKNRGDMTLPDDGTAPLWVAKWLWDPAGNPRKFIYDSAASGEHPPWVPKRKGAKEWLVDHNAIWDAPAMTNAAGNPLKSKEGTSAADALVTFDEQPLSLLLLNLAGMGKKEAPDVRWHLKKEALKKALHQCGPLALNMTHSGHYVLLCGYRGSHMYILDPGKVLFRSWGLGQKQIEDKNWQQAGKPCKDHVFSSLDASGDFVVIDAEAPFEVNAEGKYSGTYLDCLLNAHGYILPGLTSFDEFLTAEAPDGRAVGGVLPTPYVAGSTPDPATTHTPPSNTPSTTHTPPPNPSPNGNPGPPASSPAADGSTAWWEKMMGKSPAVAARAVVTITDVDTGKPLPDFEVEVTGLQKGKTGADGVWRSPDFPLGTYDLKARKTGFGPKGSPTAPPSEGEHWQQQIAFKAGDNSFAVEMTDMRTASAVITVREATSHRLLDGVEVEIWSIATGTTNASGEYASRTFAPGKSYDVKARKAGFGPPSADSAPVEGEVCKSQVYFSGGKQLVVLLMAETRPPAPSPPSDLRKDEATLSIVSTTKVVNYDSFVAKGDTAVFEFKSNVSALVTEWTAYDPGGIAVETETDIVGHTFDITAADLEGHFRKVGPLCFGTWTVRCCHDDYYADWTFVLQGAMPPLPVDRKPPPKPPAPPAPKPPSPKPSTPAPPREVPASHLGDELSVGAWEDFLDGTVPAEILQQIKDVRDRIPPSALKAIGKPLTKTRPVSHCWMLMDKGSDLAPKYREAWLPPRDEAVREAKAKLDADPTEANSEAYAVARADRLLTGAYLALLGREGGPPSINTYDDAILTWGTGFAYGGKPPGGGALSGLFGEVQTRSEKIRTFFHNCGFHYANKDLQVVNVTSGKVLRNGDAAEHFCDPAQSDSPARQSDKQLLDMLVLAARDPDMRDAIWEANLARFKAIHKGMKDLHLIASQGVATMIIHLHHWGPALVPSPIAYAARHDEKVILTEAPSLKRDVRFALWAIRQAYSGFQPRFVQAKSFWQDMIDDTNEDGTPLPLDELAGADAIMYQKGFKFGSAEAAQILEDHRRIPNDPKKSQSGWVYDMGPLTDFPKD